MATEVMQPAATEPDVLPVVAKIGTPSLRGVVRLVAIVATCAGALYLLYLTRNVVEIVAIAVFTAMALAPVVDAVQRLHVPRAGAIVLVYLACVLAVAGVGALVVPRRGFPGQRPLPRRAPGGRPAAQ
jgi:predicted PurR-regulated permease PerM